MINEVTDFHFSQRTILIGLSFRCTASAPRPSAFSAVVRASTRCFTVPDDLPPGPLARLLPMRVGRVESLRPEFAQAVFDLETM